MSSAAASCSTCFLFLSAYTYVEDSALTLVIKTNKTTFSSSYWGAFDGVATLAPCLVQCYHIAHDTSENTNRKPQPTAPAARGTRPRATCSLRFTNRLIVAQQQMSVQISGKNIPQIRGLASCTVEKDSG